MIADAFFSFVRFVADLIISAIEVIPVDIPDLSGTLGNIASFIGGTYGGVIGWFPFGTFGAALGVLLVWMLACHAFRLVLWILGVLHVSGTDN